MAATMPPGARAPFGHVVGGGRALPGKVFSAATLSPGSVAPVPLDSLALAAASSVHRAFGERRARGDWLAAACAVVDPLARWSWLASSASGHAAVYATLRELDEAFPRDGAFVLERAIVQGDVIALELVLDGTLEGSLRVGDRIVAPTRARARLAVCAIVRIAAAMIVEVRHYADPRGVLHVGA